MDYDAIVVGSGAGGAAAAARLVAVGWRVLVVERGRRLIANETTRDEVQMVERRVAGDDRELRLNGRRERLALASVVGGGTALYGAAMVRPAPEDFRPSQDLPADLGKIELEGLEAADRDWPVAYEELEPYFEQLEDAYSVAGEWRADCGSLGRRRRPYSQNPVGLTSINRRLHEVLLRRGRQPFALPLAIDWRRCRRCAACPGFACPNDSRRSSVGALLEPARRSGRLEIWDGTEVLSVLRRKGRRVDGVRLRQRASGLEAEVRSRVVVLAAGALGTPVILLRSGLGTDLPAVGRFHMVHFGVLGGALFPSSFEADVQFHKQLGYAGHYRVERQGHRHKMGLVQAIPAPGPRTIRSQIGRWLPVSGARWLHRRLLMFGALVADLPRARNRVWVDRSGVLRLERSFHRYDELRGRWMKKRIVDDLRAAHPLGVFGLDGGRALHLVTHQVGTCRMGRSPRTSVTDAEGRVHGFENLFVADGSLMPSSMGVGPALTIGALGLHVADRLLGRSPSSVSFHECPDVRELQLIGRSAVPGGLGEGGVTRRTLGARKDEMSHFRPRESLGSSDRPRDL